MECLQRNNYFVESTNNFLLRGSEDILKNKITKWNKQNYSHKILGIIKIPSKDTPTNFPVDF